MSLQEVRTVGSILGEMADDDAQVTRIINDNLC